MLVLQIDFKNSKFQVPGMTKRDNNMWLYSNKAVELISSYMHKYPELFERLEKNVASSDMFLKNELFPEKG